MAEFSGVSAGIKKQGKNDIGLILIPYGAKVLGFFTSNRIRSEVVERAIPLIRRGRIRAVVVVAGNAMCRYPGVEKDAEKIAVSISQELRKKGEEISKDEVLVLATGIIGEKLPLEKVIRAIPELVRKLSPKYEDFASAIITTDTKTKIVKFKEGNALILGIAKGAGMIFPHFSEATTLSFIISNTTVPKRKAEIKNLLLRTFGSINIDASMSTNDSSIFIFEGKSREREKTIMEGIEYILSNLALKIAEDGEGVKHVVKLEVFGAESERSAKKICEAISSYLLFKCSIAGASPNFGRILAAIGSTKESIGYINVFLSDEFEFGKAELKKEEREKVQVIKESKVIEFDKNKAKKIMSQKYYTIKVDVGLKGVGVKENGRAYMLMTDITEKYVRLNME